MPTPKPRWHTVALILAIAAGMAFAMQHEIGPPGVIKRLPTHNRPPIQPLP